MEERVYIEERWGVFEIKHENGKGVRKVAECYDYYLAKEVAETIAKYILCENVFHEVQHFKEDEDTKEGWYRV